MQDKNICKFVPLSASEGLCVSNFILESNQETIRSHSVLKQHRAILVLQGEGEFFFDEKPVPFAPGSLIFGFGQEHFTVQCPKKCEYMYISFDGMRAKELLKRFAITVENRSFSGFDGLLPLWRDSLFRASAQNVDLAAESILLYTFSRLTAEPVQDNGLINRMVALSEEHFHDAALTLNSVADELGHNAKYLSGVFKEKMGISYTEYLRTLRIKYAVSLFEHGIDSVKNVALLSGFSDPLYFSTVFKKQTGFTPLEYKKLSI
jgi:AraC-like DNA-binding protein